MAARAELGDNLRTYEIGKVTKLMDMPERIPDKVTIKHKDGL